MPYILYFFAALAGAILTVQVSMNSKLSHSIGDTTWGVLLSFVIGTIAIVCYLLLTMHPIPNLAQLKTMPTFGWFGGFLGAMYVLSITYVAPKIGFTTAFALVVGGQLCASLIMEHYAFMGAPHNPLTIKKILACGLILLGIILSK